MRAAIRIAPDGWWTPCFAPHFHPSQFKIGMSMFYLKKNYRLLDVRWFKDEDCPADPETGAYWPVCWMTVELA